LNIRIKDLSSAVRLALSLGAAVTLGVSGLAYAEDATPQGGQADQPAEGNAVQLQGVVVTG